MDSSVRISVSPTIHYAVIIGLLGAYGGGAWFLATQSATNLALSERQNRFEAVTASRLDAVDKRDDVRSNAIASIDNRLTRIEAQLAYLVTSAGAARR